MARDKERSVNPVQQQRKLEKAKQLKKSRTELQARRNEKLARRNPERIQRQIDDLKALEASGDIKPREKAILEGLERDLKAIRKAREALGDKAPHFGGQQRGREGETHNVLGKRRHDGGRKHFPSRVNSSGSDTDESVRRIPMPEDTPPPIPREFRHSYRNAEHNRENMDARLPKSAPAPVPKTTYESAPQIRDLRKEAVGRFVPDVVRRKQEAAKGGVTGYLIEPEEMDRLEAEGYLPTGQGKPRTNGKSENAGEDQASAQRLAEEEERFLRELQMQDVSEEILEENGQESSVPNRSTEQQSQRRGKPVEIEEVEDEDA
ncbi:uncharacterized protein Z518_01199 [Rhinocladiella mackenziei CBS 650.93]|uniref:Wbp11/ELF5/Saf1 N-terminal domain-containing protein n=1 Tax=Rhinocladiella mackenziei CBS 650.93 TaxID=1442369 RepID=A0A0D2HHI6_9EURO|nr:uncharacterized protein Z518_01199 [Rhinocladiella mackenziei CBS 650.93]KIX10118.1 hypothetical protein Z518_01199 [Rhinocladiella mackenziei CBS 650.93]